MKNVRKLKIKYSASIIAIVLMMGTISSAVVAAEVDASEYSVLQEQENYVIGFTDEHSPFSYTDDEGNIKGMAIDMMNYIAETAGINVTYVPLDADVDSSDIDINLSILATDQVDDVSIRSTPYFQLQMILMGVDGNIVIEDAVIGHLDYSAINNTMVEEGLEGCTAYTYENYTDLKNALESGELNYILTSSLVAKQTSALGESLDIYTVQTDFNLDLMLKFNDSMDEDKIDAFNAVIAELETGYKYTIMLNAAIVGATDQITTYDIITEYNFEILFGLAILTVIIITIILYFNINKRRALLKTLNEDELTGLASAYRFTEVVQALLNKSKKETIYYIISFDLDNFKYINESYGYEKGTEVIKAFADTLKVSFARAECISRTFADNFLICTTVEPIDGHICGGQNCVKCIDRAAESVLGSDYKLMTSVGIYKITDKTVSLAYMIDCANIARRRGKGTYSRTEYLFTEEMEEDRKKQNTITSSMEQGLRKKEFKMHYQPKIDFETKKIVGAEALVRWYKEDGTQIFPDQFITLFEKNGFISKLDYYVLNEVCMFLKENPDMPNISVNISGYSFLELELVENIMRIVEENGIDTSRIEIEITESAIVNEFEIISAKIEALQRLGFVVSMDDFGAGLSSLNRLKDISIDVLKIDREFLGGETLNNKGVNILESIIDMSKKISITTVAEGVETKSQVELLKDLSCNVAQGYYYSKPLPEDAFMQYVKENRI